MSLLKGRKPQWRHPWCRVKVCWPSGNIPVLPSPQLWWEKLWMSEKAAEDTPSKHSTMKSSSQLKITSKDACPREGTFTPCPQAGSLQRWGDGTLSTTQTAPPNTAFLQGIYTTRRVLLTQDLSPHSVPAWKQMNELKPLQTHLGAQAAAAPEGKEAHHNFIFHFLFFFYVRKLKSSLLAWYLVPEPLASANAACKILLTDDCRGSHKLCRAYHNHRMQHYPKSDSLSPDTCDTSYRSVTAKSWHFGKWSKTLVTTGMRGPHMKCTEKSSTKHSPIN